MFGRELSDLVRVVRLSWLSVKGRLLFAKVLKRLQLIMG